MKGDSHVYAAREFPFIGVVGGSGSGACLGARCNPGRRRSVSCDGSSSASNDRPAGDAVQSAACSIVCTAQSMRATSGR